MKRNTLMLTAIIVVVLGALIGLAFLLKSVSPEKVQPDPNIKGAAVQTRDYSHMTGPANAKVQLVEYGDYQCPFCGAAYQPVKTVVDKYKNNPNFTFVFRNFPLSQHPNAQEAAEAAEAAGAQGKYFEMHDMLYQNQNDWSGTLSPTSAFESYAQTLGLDVNKFKSDLTTNKYINNITQDQADGEALGVNATPTFFLNGQKLDGYTELDSQIAAALAK